MALRPGKQPSHIKRAQKESLLYRELSQLLLQIAMDEPTLQTLFINRVQLSPDKGMCTIFLYTSGGKEEFDRLLPTLILYKPSLRKALAAAIPARYTPELTFKFDAQFEKQNRIENLLEKLKDEGQL